MKIKNLSINRIHSTDFVIYLLIIEPATTSGTEWDAKDVYQRLGRATHTSLWGIPDSGSALTSIDAYLTNGWEISRAESRLSWGRNHWGGAIS